MRTASPGMVTRAIMRTVAFVTAVAPSVCCEVLQAVIHRADADGCWNATIPGAESNITTATDAVLRSRPTLVIASPKCCRSSKVAAIIAAKSAPLSCELRIAPQEDTPVLFQAKSPNEFVDQDSIYRRLAEEPGYALVIF